MWMKAFIVAAALAAASPTIAAEPPPPPLSETKERISWEQMEVLVAEPMRLVAAGDMAAADVALDRLLEERRRQYGAGSIEVADTLVSFMILTYARDRRVEALAYGPRVLDAVRMAWGSDHLEYALLLTDLVMMDLRTDGDAGPEAEAGLIEAYRIRRDRLGELHKETISTLIYLGEVQGLRSRTDGDINKAMPAIATLQKAIADADQIREPGYTDAVWARRVLASTFARNGALGPAMQTFDKTMELAAEQQADWFFQASNFKDALHEGGFEAEAAEIERALIEALGLPPNAPAGGTNEPDASRGQASEVTGVAPP
ncbi:MAG: hypothetical protein ACOY5Y_15815 [Pseudomonadota bacterium]